MAIATGRATKVELRKNSLPFSLGVSLAVFSFAWLIRKEVQLPAAFLWGLGGVGLALLFLAALRRPECSLYALAAYVPFNRVLVGDFGTGWMGLNLTNILMGLATLGWLTRAAANRRPLIRGTALNTWIALFSVFGLLAVVRGSQVGSGVWLDLDVIVQMKRWLTPIWLFFIGANIVNDRVTIARVMAIVSLVVVVIAAMAVRDYSYVVGSNIEHARISGVLGQPNALGAFFAYYMFLMAGLFLTYTKRARAWFLLFPLALCFRGIMVTFSRGAYLACAAGALAICVMRSKRLFVVAVALGVIVALNPMLLPSGVRYRFSQTVEQRGSAAEGLEGSLESSAKTRLLVWRGAVRMIQDHPLWGVGFDMFQRFLPFYTPERLRMDAHNTYLLVAAEMGIPAAIVFVIILLLILAQAVGLARASTDRLLRALGLGVASGTVALLVSNLFGSRMNAEDLISYFWLLAGVVAAARILVRRGLLA